MTPYESTHEDGPEGRRREQRASVRVNLGNNVLLLDGVVGDVEGHVHLGGVEGAQVLAPGAERRVERRRQALSLLVLCGEVGSLEDVHAHRGREFGVDSLLVSAIAKMCEKRAQKEGVDRGTYPTSMYAMTVSISS